MKGCGVESPVSGSNRHQGVYLCGVSCVVCLMSLSCLPVIFVIPIG